MAAYRRVYDSRYLQADCQERNHTLGNRVWATFIYSTVPSRNRKEHFFSAALRRLLLHADERFSQFRRVSETDGRRRCGI